MALDYLSFVVVFDLLVSEVSRSDLGYMRVRIIGKHASNRVDMQPSLHFRGVQSITIIWSLIGLVYEGKKRSI